MGGQSQLKRVRLIKSQRRRELCGQHVVTVISRGLHQHFLRVLGVARVQQVGLKEHLNTSAKKGEELLRRRVRARAQLHPARTRQ